MTRNYRITPLGFISMSIIVLMITFSSAIIIRQTTDSNQVIYGINKTLHQEEQSFDSTFSFRTIGDAVIYESKDITSHNYIYYSGESIYIDGAFKSNSTQFPHYQLLLDRELLTLKPNDSNQPLSIHFDQIATIADPDYAFRLTELWSILKLTDEEVNQFSNRDIQMIVKQLPLSSTTADSYTIKMTIREWFDTTDRILLEISDYEDFTQSIQKRFSAFYDSFAHHTLLKENKLNSRILFLQMVDINDDFYATFNQLLQSFEHQFESLYTDDSYLEIKLLLVDNKISSIHIKSDLFYKSCDAYESLQLTFFATDIKEADFSANEIGNLGPYIKDSLQTMQSIFK
jgi:hypothetical protein